MVRRVKNILIFMFLTVILLKIIDENGEVMRVFYKISDENNKNAFKVLLIEKI